MDLPIIYEDTNVVAVNKPTGLIVHADGRTNEPTAEEWFIGRYGRKGGYVHRLDRDTSGVLVFAKNEQAYNFLRKAFHDRDVKKTYLALVHGVLKEKKGIIDFDIGRSRKDFRLRSAQPKAKGRLRDAITHYEVVGEISDASLLKLQPETGRTHQIRVHLKAIHHPVIGDALYAPHQKLLYGLTRLALHASTLDLPLPSGGRILITAPLPEDLTAAFAHIAAPPMS